MYVRIGTYFSSQLQVFVIYLRYVRSCMEDRYMFILFYFCFLFSDCCSFRFKCPCEVLYMYISVVSEGLMKD